MTYQFTNSQLDQFLQKEDTLFLSGGIGTELACKDVHNTIASLYAKDVLKSIHEDYAKAGADILTVDTFELSEWRQRNNSKGAPFVTIHGIREAYNVARAAQAVVPNKPLYFAGSVTSLNDCYNPDATPNEDILDVEHRTTIGYHALHKPDLLCLETVPSVKEAAAMAKAAELFEIPHLIVLSAGEKGKIRDGRTYEDAERATRSKYRIGIGINCCQISDAKESVERLRAVFAKDSSLANQRIAAYPNGYVHSLADYQLLTGNDITGKHCNELESQKHFVPSDSFAKAALDLRDRGATIIGGCCGTSPAHTQAYVQALRQKSSQTQRLAAVA